MVNKDVYNTSQSHHKFIILNASLPYLVKH